jgi:hypothetical protein
MEIPFEGPVEITIESCAKCVHCLSERITVGCDVSCVHPSMYSTWGYDSKHIRRFDDGIIWKTPDWCPVKFQ